MKRFLLISGFAILIICVVAQNDSMMPISHFNNLKKEIRLEASEINKLLVDVKTEYILDSIVYYQYATEMDSVLNSKTEYIYFGNGEQHRIKYVWNEISGMWDNLQKTVYIFDENDNLTEYQRIAWDNISNIWLNEIKFVMTYNAAGQETLFLYYIWDEVSGEWGNYYKEEYTYDGNDNLISYYSWIWDESLNEWIEDWYEETLYNNSGLLIEQTAFSWDETLSDWQGEYKSEYQYDNSDYLVLIKSYNWNFNIIDWWLDHKSIYTNNSTGNPVLILLFESYDNGITWFESYKTEKTYNSDELEILAVHSLMDIYSLEWIYTAKEEFDWDEYGNRILDNRYSWENSLNDWHLFLMTEHSFYSFGIIQSSEFYSYDESLGLLTGDYKDFYYRNADEKCTVKYEWVWDISSSDWILDTKGYFHYTTFTNYEGIKDTKFEIYPNPAEKELTLHVKNPGTVKYSIYNLNGNLLFDGSTSQQSEQINIEGLSIGVYLIIIDNGNETYTRRFVKD